MGTSVSARMRTGVLPSGASENVFGSLAGEKRDSLTLPGGVKMGLYCNAGLVCYVGHNGLMDFNVPSDYPQMVRGKRQAVIILCCMSRQYFYSQVKRLDADVVLMTTGIMAPEAYTLESAIIDWSLGKSKAEIRNNAAVIYNKYQKCGMEAAKRLFFTE
jgi:hypothetical protein